MGFFDRPDDYSKMLNRMAFITGILVFISSAFLTQALSEIGMTLPSPKALANQEISVFGFKGSFWALAPAVLLAWIFRRVRIHDRVSDIFGIREAFDTHVILSRLAGEVGIPVDLKALRIFRQNRQDLMYKVFYPYVDAYSPKISKHHVAEALDAWFGYWIAIEAAVVIIFFGIIFLILKSFLFSALFLMIALICILITLRYFKTCAPLAEQEITAMVNHSDWPQWKKDIIVHFNNALQG